MGNIVMLAEKNPADRYSEFLDRCRAMGLKGTHQRAEIYRELEGTDEHPDAKTIYRRVRRRMPAISFDTVYRTLRLFEEKGVISSVAYASGSARFDANTARHGHFVCTSCGYVGDVFAEELASLQVPEIACRLGRVDAVHVELRGICTTCLAMKETKP